jgi:hypothetical protein
LLEHIQELFGASVDKVHKKAKRAVVEQLSDANIRSHANRAFNIADQQLRPLLNSQINGRFAAAITQQTNQLIARCAELERLKGGSYY